MNGKHRLSYPTQCCTGYQRDWQKPHPHPQTAPVRNSVFWGHPHPRESSILTILAKSLSPDKKKSLRWLLISVWWPQCFSSLQSLRRVWLFATPWTAARQASLSITSSPSLLRLTSIELVMPSNHLVLCRPLLPPSIFPSIRVFSTESVLRMRWPILVVWRKKRY